MSGFRTHLYGGMVAGAATSTCFVLTYPSIFTTTQLSGIFLTGSIGGLLPDLDSDTSRPFTMLFTLLSMIVPVLFFKEISMIWLYITPHIETLSIYFSKFLSFSINFFISEQNSLTKQFSFTLKLAPFPTIEHITPEFIVTYFLISYLFIRYVVCEIVKRVTIHRGIMHSIPFALLCSEVGIIIFIPSGKMMAIAVGISIFAGFITHLLLDEVNSVKLKYGVLPKFKKSSGSAFKFKSQSIVATLIVYLLVIVSGVRVMELIF